jgi:hypothetical protein
MKMSRHEFKSETGRWTLIVDEHGFHLWDKENPTDAVIDASTLFTNENAWIELLDPNGVYDFYSLCHGYQNSNSFGLRAKKDE